MRCILLYYVMDYYGGILYMPVFPAFLQDRKPIFLKGMTTLSVDLQKASLWKRVAAWLLDLILLCVLATGFAFGLSALLGYDGYNRTLEEAYASYEGQYGVQFDIDLQTYEAMTEEEKQLFDAANKALSEDKEATHAYNMLINLSMLITTGGILLAMLALEFALPLWLKNGQTVGKKVFGLGLVRTDGVKLNTMQLFVRTLLGKYTVETMIPVYLVLMMFWGMMDITGTIVLCILGITQIVLLIVTRTNAQLHDLMAGTVVVDIASQRIFASTEELVEYTKRIHADRAARQEY